MLLETLDRHVMLGVGNKNVCGLNFYLKNLHLKSYQLPRN